MSDDLAPNQILGSRYKIEKFLGEGGMGQVYKALDLNLDRVVALKTFLPSLNSSRTERFDIEAKSMAKLNHTNIAQIYDSSCDNGRYFIVTQFVEGETLGYVLKNNKALLTLDKIIQIGIDVCLGLGYAHSQGIIHRDIKSSNLMLQTDGQIIIVDFGIAKILDKPSSLTQGLPVGTPLYYSPEQAMGKDDIDGRADIYSLGVVLFELLTGRCPFIGKNDQAIWHMHITTPVPNIQELNPDIPDSLAQIINRALAKEPFERFQSPPEMAEALGNVRRVLNAQNHKNAIVELPKTPIKLPNKSNFINYDHEAQKEIFHLLIDNILNELESAKQILGADFINQFCVKVSEVYKQLEKKIDLAFIGPFKSGKSTLVNALLGAKVVTTDPLPETITINQIDYGSSLKVEVYFPNGRHFILSPDEMKSEKLKKLIERLSCNPDYLHISFPNPFLVGVNLVDTPGLGNSAYFDSCVWRYFDSIKQTDTIIYVISALAQISLEDFQLLKRLEILLRSNEIFKICIIINHLDYISSEKDKDRVIQLIQNKLVEIFPNPEIFAISAQKEFLYTQNRYKPSSKMEECLRSNFQYFQKYLEDIILSRNLSKMEQAILELKQLIQACVLQLTQRENKNSMAIQLGLIETEKSIKVGQEIKNLLDCMEKFQIVLNNFQNQLQIYKEKK